ncbi:MAG: hypothetical protein JWQ07_4352 [Ramlibacter sp.]|nr:hypothetical protein [Ramlibacter sp.]
MSDICFITTCRGRREHLEQSLPILVGQAGTSCVVVDYDCPDGAGGWVEAGYPLVKVVRSGSRPRFEAARARNLGAQAAQAPWLCFVDADALLGADFAASVRPLLQRGSFYLASPHRGDMTGLCIVHRDDFQSVGGYDQVMQGWGMEDKDFYFRLLLSGLAEGSFPSALASMIRHGTELRVAHYDVKQTELSSTSNLVYCRAKWDLMRLGGRPLEEHERTALYQNISRLVLDAHSRGAGVQVRVPFSSQTSHSGAVLGCSLVYELGALPGVAKQAA